MKDFNKKTITITIVLVIVSGVLGFALGKYTAKPSFKKIGIEGRMGQDGNIDFSKMGGRQAGMRFQGEIMSRDGNSMTIRMRDNTGSKNVINPESVNVYKSIRGSMEDLTPGMSISITGKQNTDGSIESQSIQIEDTTTTEGNQ